MASRTRSILVALAVAGLLAAALAAALAGARALPIADWAPALIAAVREAGVAGAALYGAVYVVATVLWIPGSLLTMAAGLVYGLAGGTLVVLPAAVAGATLAFLIARFVARDWVRGRVAHRPRMAAVHAAVSEHGFSMVLLLRLSPLFPFVLLNYALGITEVRLRDYVPATVAGMVPGTFLFVYLGTLATDAAALATGARPDGGAAERALFWGGLAITLGVTVWISRLARRRLERALAR